MYVCMYVSGWWLDVEEKTTASNDWIGCNFKLFRGHTFSVLEKITIHLNETSLSSKFCLKTFLNHASVDHPSK